MGALELVFFLSYKRGFWSNKFKRTLILKIQVLFLLAPSCDKFGIGKLGYTWGKTDPLITAQRRPSASESNPEQT